MVPLVFPILKYLCHALMQKSNPLSEAESRALGDAIGKAKVKGIFQDQLRAERESFKAVFDKRHGTSYDPKDE